MGDPNVYWGSGAGGTTKARVNAVSTFGVDNTGTVDAGPNIQKALNALCSAAFAAAQILWFPKGGFASKGPADPKVGALPINP